MLAVKDEGDDFTAAVGEKISILSGISYVVRTFSRKGSPPGRAFFPPASVFMPSKSSPRASIAVPPVPCFSIAPAGDVVIRTIMIANEINT
jgi:hypothetical protein